MSCLCLKNWRTLLIERYLWSISELDGAGAKSWSVIFTSLFLNTHTSLFGAFARGCFPGSLWLFPLLTFYAVLIQSCS